MKPGRLHWAVNAIRRDAINLPILLSQQPNSDTEQFINPPLPALAPPVQTEITVDVSPFDNMHRFCGKKCLKYFFAVIMVQHHNNDNWRKMMLFQNLHNM